MSGGNNNIENSRVDLAATSINDFAVKVQTVVPAGTLTNSALSTMIYRHECNPFVTKTTTATTALMSEAVAKASPYFMSHVSQFIVEFAGDYLSQNPDGTPSVFPTAATPINPDGVTDFMFDRSQDVPKTAYNAATHAVPSPKWVKKIRWYGLPRDTDADNSVPSPLNTTLATSYDTVSTVTDANVDAASASFVPPFVIFEVPKPPALKGAGNYATTYNLASPGPYHCDYAFKKGQMPTMVRILMKVDDPTGRVQDGPWTECVFNLQQ